MAQKRTFEFEADDSTFDFNQRVLDCIIPGIYHGFDAVLAAGLTLNLSQEVSGVSSVDENLLNTPKNGMYITKQGVIVRENGIISLPIDIGDAINPRIDLIVAEHIYTEVVGGQPASYLIIKGNPGANPVPPVLTSENKQTIIGELLVPTNMSGLNDPGVVYTKSEQPGFSDNNYLNRILQNESDISQNSDNITDNAAAIVVNADAISQNEDDIIINEDDIADNTADIVTLNNRVDALEAKTRLEIDIVDWNLDNDQFKSVSHGLSATQWKTIKILSITIKNDNDNEYFDLYRINTLGIPQAGIRSFNSTDIELMRLTGGDFDNSLFDSIGGFIRGTILLEYVQ